MTYSRPEIAVLGDATDVIQGSKVLTPDIEAPMNDELGAAYTPEE